MAATNDKLAFLFPGQGSQSVGMLKELAAVYPEVQQLYAEASEALGFDLWGMVAEGSVEQLGLTENTQPAMLAAGVAAYRVWCRRSDTRPAWLAGHSLGEYTALVCGEAIEFRDGIRLVRERGRLMQSAIPEGQGAMAAILGLEDPKVVEICAAIAAEGEVVTPANFNAPGQLVIAGAAGAVARAVDAAKQAGAKRAVLLPVSVPSHCPLMAGAASQFKAVLDSVAIQPPAIPVVHNVDVAVHSSAESIRGALERQLYSSVRWSDSVRFMFDRGVTQFIECGPGKVLMGLNKRIVPDGRVEAVFSPDSLDKALELVA